MVDLDQPKHGERARAIPPEWDQPGVVDGEDMFAVLCQLHAPDGRLPIDTHTVSTASGGVHLYYRHSVASPDLRNTAGLLAPLIDTRAHGGYVVGAESVVGGRAYTTAYDVTPEPLPEWLADRLEPAPLPPQRPVTVDLPADRGGAYLRAAVERTVADLRAAGGGKRNAALYGAAVSLGQLVAGGSLSVDYVTGLLAQVASEIGQRPAEAARTIRSGLKAGANRPRTVAA